MRRRKRVPREIRFCKCECGETFECRITDLKLFINREHYMRWRKDNHIDYFDHSNGPWNKGLTKETDERVRKNGEAVSKSLKGYKRSDEYCKKNRENRLKEWKDPEFRKDRSDSRRKFWDSEEGVQLKEQIGKQKEELWRNPEYVARQIRSRHTKPNRPEKFLTKLFSKVVS